MSIQGYKRLTITLSLVCLLSLGVAIFFFSKHAILSVRTVLATEQISIFSEMRAKALKADEHTAASCLQYVVGYYPSGTKQVPGSRLDRLVEQQRASVVKDIVAHLRSQTGQDLGEAPEMWIQKYSK